MSERIDLSVLETTKLADSGVELELKHPASGEPLPRWVLRVRGYDSLTYRRAEEEDLRRALDRGKRAATPEELRVDRLDLQASLVAGWPEYFDLDGKPFPHSAGNVRVLLERFPWIAEQVLRFARERGNFLPGSASS